MENKKFHPLLLIEIIINLICFGVLIFYCSVSISFFNDFLTSIGATETPDKDVAALFIILAILLLITVVGFIFSILQFIVIKSTPKKYYKRMWIFIVTLVSVLASIGLLISMLINSLDAIFVAMLIGFGISLILLIVDFTKTIKKYKLEKAMEEQNAKIQKENINTALDD